MFHMFGSRPPPRHKTAGARSPHGRLMLAFRPAATSECCSSGIEPVDRESSEPAKRFATLLAATKGLDPIIDAVQQEGQTTRKRTMSRH
jgi:hypothetical protein